MQKLTMDVFGINSMYMTAGIVHFVSFFAVTACDTFQVSIENILFLQISPQIFCIYVFLFDQIEFSASICAHVSLPSYSHICMFMVDMNNSKRIINSCNIKILRKVISNSLNKRFNF